MFAEKPQDYIPYARVEVIREAVGTDKMVSQVFDGPVWIQAKRVIDYFEETIMSAYTVREEGLIGHRMVYNWPRDMFAELATNCILHKEYGGQKMRWRQTIHRHFCLNPATKQIMLLEIF